MRHLRSALSPFCNLPVAYMVTFAVFIVLSRVLSTDAKAVTGLTVTTVVLGAIICALKKGKLKLHGMEGLLLPLFACAAYAYWISILIGAAERTTTIFVTSPAP